MPCVVMCPHGFAEGANEGYARVDTDPQNISCDEVDEDAYED